MGQTAAARGSAEGVVSETGPADGADKSSGIAAREANCALRREFMALFPAHGRRLLRDANRQIAVSWKLG